MFYKPATMGIIKAGNHEMVVVVRTNRNKKGNTVLRKI